VSWSLLEAIRKNPDVLRDSLKKRFLPTDLADKAIELDRKWREIQKEVDRLRHEHNVISQKVARAKPEEQEALKEKAKELLQTLEAKEKELEEIEKQRDEVLRSLPNFVHETVPIGPDDTYNKPIRVWGLFKVYKDDVEAFKSQLGGLQADYTVMDRRPFGHAEELEEVLRLGNTLKAGEVAGSRFYYLFDDIVWLDFALLLYAIDVLTQKGYTLVLPPYMLRGEVISRRY
jgi:seryl-tRNA synthetase (EC 6.1.1.11)